MIGPKSRYRDARFFEPDDRTGRFFPGVRAREIGPSTPVLEHEIRAGDRLDRMAHYYYGDDRLWWRIVDANPEQISASSMLDEDLLGTVILIPGARE